MKCQRCGKIFGQLDTRQKYCQACSLGGFRIYENQKQVSRIVQEKRREVWKKAYKKRMEDPIKREKELERQRIKNRKLYVSKKEGRKDFS